MPIIPCDCASCTTAPEVGTPNFVEETPTEVRTLAVPVPSSSAGEVFDSLAVRDALIVNRTPDAWTEQLARINESLNPINLDVLVGGYAVGMTEPRMASGTTVTALGREVSDEFVRTASAGRLYIEQAENGKHYVRAVTHLENEAWKLYTGEGWFLREFGGAAEEFSFYDLKERLQVYRDFRRTERRTYVREALKLARLKKVDAKKSAEWDHERAAKFEKFLEGVKAKLVREDNSFKHLPILPHRTLSSRNWGIEIEAVDIEGVKTPEYWELKGDGSLRPLSDRSIASRSEAHETMCARTRNLDAECDCSRNRSIADRYTEQGEWNSPVLRSYHSRGLKHLTDAIEHRRTNHSAGIHVHVEASDLSPTQATNLAIIYSAVEPLFQHEYDRAVRTYCQPVDTAEMIVRFNKLKEAKDNGSAIRDMRYTSRYWTVNMASLSSHGTIEFRAMGARYNYEHLIRWAYLCREMVNLAKADVPQKAWAQVKTMQDLVVLFSRYGKETPTPEWASNVEAKDVIAALGSELRRKPHGLPLIPGNEHGPIRVFDDYNSREPLLQDEDELLLL